MLTLAKQVGFTGELHLSTLANVSHPSGLETAKRLGAKRVVIPRELNLDEVKLMADACPKDLDLEIFVHGALCHCVSGRCYWSSYLGGKIRSSRTLRPALPSTLFAGQKKSGTTLFLFRPLSGPPDQTLALHAQGGRPGRSRDARRDRTTFSIRSRLTSCCATIRRMPRPRKRRWTCLIRPLAAPQPIPHSCRNAPSCPSNPARRPVRAASWGEIKRDQKQLYFQPRVQLNTGDMIRVGYEDQPGHRTLAIRRRVPKRGRMDIPFSKQHSGPPLPTGHQGLSGGPTRT